MDEHRQGRRDLAQRILDNAVDTGGSLLASGLQPPILAGYLEAQARRISRLGFQIVRDGDEVVLA